MKNKIRTLAADRLETMPAATSTNTAEPPPESAWRFRLVENPALSEACLWPA